MISHEQRDDIAILTLAHGKANLFDVEFCRAVAAALDECAVSSARAAVLIAGGSIFSAGVDLRRLVDGGHRYAEEFLPALGHAFDVAFAFPKPLVAAVNGHAIAGGCILASACDHRIMVEGNGRIGIPELAVGVPFPALPLQIMSARVADGPLRDLVFTGRTVLIDEAKALGLIDEKCPAGMLMDRALEVAQRMTTIPAGAFALTKQAFYTPILERTKQLAEMNAHVVDAWLQPHTYETIRKYLDRTIKK